MRQLISPLIEFTGHMVGRQRAAMGVEQEDQLHQDRRRVGLLGAKVEHRHDVALIVTAHRESDLGRVPLGKGWPLLDPASSAPGTGWGDWS